MRKFFISWIPLAVIIIGLSGLVYVTVQQNYRSSANDPQIQMAEDGASLLEGGALPPAVVASSTVQIDKSLAVYTIVFNDLEKPVESSALLNNRIPVPPPGVFEYLRHNPEDRFTWQPALNVRSAVVMRHYDGQNPGFILVGRSLREVEIREGQLTINVALAAISLLVFSFVFSFVCSLFAAKPSLE